MGEMAQAMRMLGNLPLVLEQWPTGRWGFTGRMPADFKYVMADGTDVPEGILAEIASACIPAYVCKAHGVKTRAFETRESAERFAVERGAKIQQVCARKAS